MFVCVLNPSPLLKCGHLFHLYIVAAFSNFFASVVTDTAGLLDKVFIMGGFGGEASTTCGFAEDIACGPSSTSICAPFNKSSLTSFSGGGSGDWTDGGGDGDLTACNFLSSSTFLVLVETAGTSPGCWTDGGGGDVSTACGFLSSSTFLVFVEAAGTSPGCHHHRNTDTSTPSLRASSPH